MIIVSQDKKTILNFSNIQNVRIEDYGTHQKGIKIYKIYAGNFEGYATLLGTYKTEERAKEVLQEIIITFSYIQLSGTYEEARLKMEIMKLGRYEMPEE